MKTRTCFLLPLAALAGFAVWYQDFDRRYTHQQEQAATEAAEQRALDQARWIDERATALKNAQRQLEQRAEERQVRKEAAAAAAAMRESLRAALAATRDEAAALRMQRERRAREGEVAAARLRATRTARAGLAAEEEFLASYIAHASGSVARVRAVVEAAQRSRLAAASDAGPASKVPARRPR